MINVIFEANCLYYKNAEVSVSCEEDLLNICITGDSRNVYLTPSQAKAMSLAVMRCLCFDPIPDPTELVRAVARAPDPLTELERRVVEAAVWYFETSWADAMPDTLLAIYPVYDAVQKLLVAQAPKDPPHLEAVARAICTAGGKDPDADWQQRSGLPTMLTVPGELPNWRMYLPQARAAVAVLEQKESK